MSTTKWHGTCNAFIPRTVDRCQGIEFDDPAEMAAHLRKVHKRRLNAYRAPGMKMELRLETGPTKGGIEAILAKYSSDVVEYETLSP